jgi:hypothetical protein
LGNDRNEDVLDAARLLHEHVAAAGTTWEELLIADESALGSDTTEDHPLEAAEPTSERPDDNAETLVLIDKLLEKPGISDHFREELNGYKFDISDGEFDEADHRYIRSLYNRLSPGSSDC